MKVFKHSDPDFGATLKAVINRANLDLVTHDVTVREILKQIKERGDAALLEYTSRFDQYDLPVKEIKVTRGEIDEARNKDVRTALPI
jgi:histidinol dehydrogenase